VYRLLANYRRRGVPCHDAYLREYYRLPEHLTEFRALAWDVYIGMKIVVTSNISTALGIANGTLAIVSSINFPAGTTFAPLTTRLADVPTLVQVASLMPTSIVIDIADRASMVDEPHPLFEGLTKNQFPLATDAGTGT